MYYAIYCKNNESSLETWRSVRQAHLQRLKELKKKNRLLLAGSLLPDDDDTPIEGVLASLIIAQFDDLEMAKEWAAADPYVTADVYSRITISPFKEALLDVDE